MAEESSSSTEPRAARRYRFGVFELDSATGELRRKGVRIRLHAQPFQVLSMLLERPGEMLTREEISRELWRDGTFVDYEHGVNSAINRLRDALGDKASNPTFIETLARRGYRFLVPVERISMEGNSASAPTLSVASAAPPSAPSLTEPSATPAGPGPGLLDRFLANPEDLPETSHPVVPTLFLLLQAMYLGFYIGALANLAEINELLSALPRPSLAFTALIVTAALLIPVRAFLLCAVLFRPPRFRTNYLKMWPFLFVLDAIWSLAPFLLLHHIPYGLAIACMTLLVYSPFAQRSLILMGAGSTRKASF